MAVKSIIDLEVNDGAFTKFAENFKKYQAILATTPATWAQATAQMDGSRKSFQAMVAASAARQMHAKVIAGAEREASRMVDYQSKSWRDIARSTKDVAGHILGATRQLLRWASLTGVFTGLLGAGGLFGIERLAASAGNMRSSSLGLGVSPGQQSAFNINYGRVIPNSGGLLSAVNAALTDPRQSAGLAAAGLTAADTRGRNAAEISVTLIDKIKTLADATSRNMLGGVHQARGLGQFITLEDFQRLKDTPASELAGYRRGFGRDVATMDLTGAQGRAWQDLQVQLTRVAHQLEVGLLKALVRLAPEIDRLSASFGKMVTDLLQSGAVEGGIRGLASGINWLGTELAKESFRTSVVTFADDVGRLAKAAATFVHWLVGDETPEEKREKEEGQKRGIWGKPTPERQEEQRRATEETFQKLWDWLKRQGSLEQPPAQGFTPEAQKEGDRSFQRLLDWLKKLPVDETGGTGFQPTSGVPSFRDMIHQAVYRPSADAPPTSPTVGRPAGPSFFGGLESGQGLPFGLLDAIWDQESKRGRNMGPSSAGALGHFQFMPATAQRFHLADPFDLGQSATAASKYLGFLYRRYGGDVAKAAAGYNWGEGNLDRDIAKHGEDWRAYLPKETAGYVRSIVNHLGIGAQPQQPGRGGTWAVNIWNHTGGNAIVTASQLPA